MNTASGGQVLVVKGEANGQNDGVIKITSNKTAWGDITGQLTTTAGGSTAADKLTISIDSGGIAFSTGGMANALVISHAGVVTTASPLTAASMPAFTGDVTTSAGAVATTIANDAVTYAKMQNVASNNRVLGAVTAGDPVELTGTQVTAMLDAVGALKGLVPASPSDTTKFLRGDATPDWHTLPASCQVDKYEFANTGATWTPPTGVKMVEVICIGGGGGGGGGRYGANGTARSGGGGGGGAHVARGMFHATDAPASAVITVGQGGTFGAGGTSPANGNPGGASDFGGILRAFGGGGGQGGQSAAVSGGGGGGGGGSVGGVGSTTSNNGGSPASTAALSISFQGASGGLSPAGFGEWGGGGGGRGNTGVGVGASFGGYSMYGGAGGGGGAQKDTNNLACASASGGSSGAILSSITGGRGAAGATDNAGSPGVAFGPYCGGGGGGGGATTGNGGVAGKGGAGYYGCGGGGGGAAGNTGATPTNGDGGNGGDGRVIVISYF